MKNVNVGLWYEIYSFLNINRIYIGAFISVLCSVLIALEICCINKLYMKNLVQYTLKKNIFMAQFASGTKIARSVPMPGLTRIDVVIMAVITIVYAGAALLRLGSADTLSSEYILNKGETVTIDLGEDKTSRFFKFCISSYNLDEGQVLTINCKTSDGTQTLLHDVVIDDPWYWQEFGAGDTKVRYIMLSTNLDDLCIMEFSLYDLDNNYIPPVNITPSEAHNLFDESEKIPEHNSFYNTCIFDEVLYGQTAYAFLNGLHINEWTHPPLGKVLIAVGMKIFGLNPFGWRIVAAVFGILMVPVIYIFALKLLKKTRFAAIACILFTFDFMHLSQSRLANIDIYLVFFIILMYYFMYRYYSMSFYDTPLRKTFVPLVFSGICMGLAVATKWSGVYAAAGLAIVFFVTVFKRYREYRYAVQSPEEKTNGISHSYIIESFKPNFIKTLIWCCIFFVIVPFAIYCASYFMYLKGPDMHGFNSIIDNIQYIYNFHAKDIIGTDHIYSSKWYEWFIMKRPMAYMFARYADGRQETIYTFGNPLVWWVGIPAFIYNVYILLEKRDMNSLFLVTAYTIQILFWIPIKRMTFIYHYFPMTPFLVLMIVYSIKEIYDKAKNKKRVIYGAYIYTGMVLLIFVMFYPILSGYTCSVWYVDTFLEYFNLWSFN